MNVATELKESGINADRNLIVNGDFTSGFTEDITTGWKKGETNKNGANIKRDQWQGAEVRYLEIVNEASASQKLNLPVRPAIDARYRLRFLYQAKLGAVCHVVIERGLGGEQEFELLPSTRHEETDADILALDLREFDEYITLDNRAETNVIIRFTCPPNDSPGQSRGLNVSA